MLARCFIGFPLMGDVLDVIEGLTDMFNDRLLVVLDEFQYLVEAEPSFPFRLQRLIDFKLSKRNLMLILCGSAVSFFENRLLGYKSPLFGRRTSSIKLKPMKFNEIKDFLPNYSMEDLIRAYGTVGGTPAYLEKLNPNKSHIENPTEIITPGSYLYDEAENLLRQEAREPKT